MCGDGSRIWGFERLVNRFIYYPTSRWVMTPADLGLEAEDVFLTPESGVRLHAWFFPHPGPLATLLFCHGNAGNISHRLENVAYLLRTGFQVLLFDYRGYGHSSGRLSEPGLYQDAATAWAYLVERTDTEGTPLVIFGRSLGGAVAIDLATRAEVDARVLSVRLIVESTFTSAQAMARLLFPFPLPPLPVKYDSLSKIKHLKMPLLVIHGKGDKLIPFTEGRALFEAAPEPKTWYPIPRAGHNDTYLVGGETYFHQLATFVTDLRVPR
jgi:fermentation-respiration switch protein FrsA (DUF1100 family)